MLSNTQANGSGQFIAVVNSRAPHMTERRMVSVTAETATPDRAMVARMAVGEVGVAAAGAIERNRYLLYRGKEQLISP